MLLESDLRAGSLSFVPKVMMETNISPELGQQEQTRGIVALGVALLSVACIMVFAYRWGGVVASAAMVFNLLIIAATFQGLMATISLATLAGFVLTLGMAVDANVLVFERIRKELQSGKKLLHAVPTGYKKSFSSIFDANITTLLSALILFHFDSGPIKGFATALIIGLLSSMFTALFVTQWFFTKWCKKHPSSSLPMAPLFKDTSFGFMRKSRYAIACSCILMALGASSFLSAGRSILGTDFTGGSSCLIPLQTQPLHNHSAANNDSAIRELIASALRSFSVDQVRILGEGQFARVLFHPDSDSEGHPDSGEIAQALNENGLSLSAEGYDTMKESWTSVSSRFSGTICRQSAWGGILALGMIFLYLMFRFDISLALSAVLCLVHDVVVTLAVVGMGFTLGLPLQIDLHTVAALLTILGYSLNDTIVIFDQLRSLPTSRTKQAEKLTPLIDLILNQTLNRTLMTSVTTAAVLVVLVLLGGNVLFNFSFVMLVGVITGTMSSLFIAGRLLIALRSKIM